MVKTRSGRKKRKITRLGPVGDIAEKIQESLEENENASIPIAIYYGVNRAVLDIPLRIRKPHAFDQLAAYDQALSGGRNDFRRFFEWYRMREDLENEQRLSAIDDPEKQRVGTKSLRYRDPQLKAVRQAIEKLADFSKLRIKRNPLRMEVRKGDRTFDVRQLSDGEKCLFALAGDLAHRLAIANPDMLNPLNGRGIVLIDEIELHFHPEWQHKIIPGLLKTFPKCQFVLTTHSPQVISHVRCRDIWCLTQAGESIRVVRPDGTYGQDSNFLLKTLLGSSFRPKHIDNDMTSLFDLIRTDTKEARKLLNRLKSEVEGESPDLVRAQMLLHRREVMNAR